MIRTTFGLLVLALLAAGCASRGNEVLRDQNASIVDQYVIDGRTTRAEIEKMYGPPTSTSFANAQNEIWTYRWARSTARAENFIPYVGAFVGGADVQSKELVILFSPQNVVVRHTMRENNDAVRRNLSASSSATGNTPQVSTSPAPAAAGATASAVTEAPAPAQQAPAQQAAARAVAATVPAPTAASIETGRWTCGMRTTAGRVYALTFTVAADRSITVGNYGNAQATVVRSSPLTFTAINPRGDRLVTFTMRGDNSLVMTGPGTTNPTSSFYDEGSCVKNGAPTG